ncbi:hypothetical protein QUW13_02810 [Enterococcus hirae]|nr:hypothetical protein [Enterococcus hirae]
MKIWAIFSVDNEYDQPENNLVKLFKNKPDFSDLFGWWTGSVEEHAGYNKADCIHQMLEGVPIRFTTYGTEYRLEEVEVEVN